MSKVVTSHVKPPIPEFRYDWCAYHDDEVENTHHYGWGQTEAEAIADLMRLDHERWEAEQEEEDAAILREHGPND